MWHIPVCFIPALFTDPSYNASPHKHEHMNRISRLNYERCLQMCIYWRDVHELKFFQALMNGGAYSEWVVRQVNPLIHAFIHAFSANIYEVLLHAGRLKITSTNTLFVLTNMPSN